MVMSDSKFKYRYSLLYKQPGDASIQFLSIETDVNNVFDMSSLIHQQVKNGKIPMDAQFISINLSDFNP